MTEQPSPLAIIEQTRRETNVFAEEGKCGSAIVNNLVAAGWITPADRIRAVVVAVRFIAARGGQSEAILRRLCAGDLLTHAAMVAATMDLLEDAHND